VILTSRKAKTPNEGMTAIPNPVGKRNEPFGVPLRLLVPRADGDVRFIASCVAAPGSAERSDLPRLSSAAEELVVAIGFET